MRRRVATITTAVGLALLMALMSSVPANAALKWRSKGLSGVKAWGSAYTGKYHGKKTKVVDARIKDNRADGKKAAILVAWTKKGYHNDYRYVWNNSGKGTTARVAVQSYNTTHLYIKECKGKTKKGKFKAKKCGHWRKYY